MRRRKARDAEHYMRHAVDLDCCHMPPFYPTARNQSRRQLCSCTRARLRSVILSFGQRFTAAR